MNVPATVLKGLPYELAKCFGMPTFAILSRIAGTCTKLTISGKDRRLWHTQEQTS